MVKTAVKKETKPAIKGLITSPERLRALCPNPDFFVWVVSGGSMYRARVVEFTKTSEHYMLREINSDGSEKDKEFSHVGSHDSMGLGAEDKRVNKVFSLRIYAERYIASRL